MNEREKTTAEIEREFDSAEISTEEIKGLRCFSKLLDKNNEV